MGQKDENRPFACRLCKRLVEKCQKGYRNHCPFCLSSLHVDETKPGDRKSHCLGIMEAKQVRWHTKKGWQIVHQCKKCGVMKANKIVDHGIQPDNINKMIQLMRR